MVMVGCGFAPLIAGCRTRRKLKTREGIMPNEKVDNDLPADAESLVARVYLL